MCAIAPPVHRARPGRNSDAFNEGEPDAHSRSAALTAPRTPSITDNQPVLELDEIVAAVPKGDIREVQRALDRNWNGSVARIERLIEIFGERGSW